MHGLEIKSWQLFLYFYIIYFKYFFILFIHPSAPNTIHFHLYISMFLNDESCQKNSCHDLILNPCIYRTALPLFICGKRICFCIFPIFLNIVFVLKCIKIYENCDFDLKERRTRGSIWLQSPLMGLTAEDTRQHAISRVEEEANISGNSISSSIEDSVCRGGEDSGDCKSCCSSDKEERVWSREEIHQLMLLKRREGLLDITMRTVNLMRRNQQLQHRLAALQAETKAFVR